MIIVDLLNSVSVVNIVMAIGISVEFLVHTAVVFLRAKVRMPVMFLVGALRAQLLAVYAEC